MVSGTVLAIIRNGGDTVATIDITKVECVKTRDGIGKDEIDIYLAIDGGPGVHLRAALPGQVQERR